MYKNLAYILLIHLKVPKNDPLNSFSYFFSETFQFNLKSFYGIFVFDLIRQFAKKIPAPLTVSCGCKNANCTAAVE